MTQPHPPPSSPLLGRNSSLIGSNVGSRWLVHNRSLYLLRVSRQDAGFDLPASISPARPLPSQCTFRTDCREQEINDRRQLRQGERAKNRGCAAESGVVGLPTPIADRIIGRSSSANSPSAREIVFKRFPSLPTRNCIQSKKVPNFRDDKHV